MPLKPIEHYPAGGVDSRSNPVNMPVDRYLMVHDFWPQQDGGIRLRDGYSLLKAGVQAGVPIHSIIAVTGPGPTYTPLVVFWQGTTPYIYNTSTKAIATPTVRGTGVASAARFSYFYTNGKLYAYNGTDAKFFDGVVWRDIGLPTLSKAQLASVSVSEGLSAVTPAEAAAVTLTPGSGGSWVALGAAYLYLAFFDTATNLLIPSNLPLGGQKLVVSVAGTARPWGFGSGAANAGAANTVVPFASGYNDGSSAGGAAGQNSGYRFGEQHAVSGETPATTIPVNSGATVVITYDSGTVATQSAGAGDSPAAGSAGLPSGGPDETNAHGYNFPTNFINGCTTCIGGIVGCFLDAVGNVIAGSFWDWASSGGTTTGTAITLVAPQGAASLSMGVNDTILRDNTGGFNLTVHVSGVGIPATPLTLSAGQKLDLANLPTRSPSTVVGLLGIDNGLSGNAKFLGTGDAASVTAMSGTGTTVTCTTAAAHGFSSGDVIVLDVGNDDWKSDGPFAITVTDTTHFTFESPDAPLYQHATPASAFNVEVLQQVANLTTTATIDDNSLDYDDQGTLFSVTGDDLLPYVNAVSTVGLPAVDLSMSNPGYEFFVSIYNPTTGHVGNRQRIGVRLANPSDATAQITGLPDVAAIDSEWRLLIGRTSMGAQIPYAIIDASGAWLVTAAGQTSIEITESQIDGNAELPTRNFPPPGTLDYEDQVNALPGNGMSI